MGPGGKILERGSFLNGEANGDWEWFFPSGRKCFTCTFSAGKLDGEAKDWFDSGELKEEGKYKNNVHVGKWTVWNYFSSNRYVEQTIEYSDDEWTRILYDSEGSIQRKETSKAHVPPYHPEIPNSVYYDVFALPEGCSDYKRFNKFQEKKEKEAKKRFGK